MASLQHTGAFMLPGIESLRQNIEKEIWWGRWEQQLFQSAVIDGATRDAGNTAQPTKLRPGLILGKVTSTDKLKEWSPTATDGTQLAHGILVYDQLTQFAGANKDRWLGYVMVGGNLKPKNILVPPSATYGLAGNANEHIIRAQLDNRFLMDDDLNGSPMWGFNNIVPKTADYTVLESDNGTLFTNRGAAGAVNFTLPATAEKGLTYGFYVVADETVTVTAGTADTMITFNDALADSVAVLTASQKIGTLFVVIGDGTGWMTVANHWDSATLAQTLTIVTA